MAIPDAGQGDWRDSEIRSYVVLWDATYDVGMFLQQFFISLLRSVFYPRQEQLQVGMETVYESFLIYKSQRRVIIDKFVKVVSFYGCQFSRFYAFQVEKTWRAFVKAFKRSYEIPFKEELESNVFPFIVEEQPQAAFVD